MSGRQHTDSPSLPHALRPSASASQHAGSSARPGDTPQKHEQLTGDAPGLPDSNAPTPFGGPSGSQRMPMPSRLSDGPASSRSAILTDAKKWFDNSNNNPTATYDASPPDPTDLFLKRESSGDDVNMSVPGMSPQAAPPFVPEGSFRPPNLAYETTRSSSSEDYRSVIDDLTIENKRLKEQLKRYKQHANRDVLENEKLFEIKMHGLPRRKKQELEATLRDFAASLGDTASVDSASQRKREKSASSKEHTSHPHHHNHLHHHNHNNSILYGSSGSRSKYASNSSSRSRPVDSAYASMSVGAHSSGPTLSRPPFGGSKARASSEQKVEQYLKDIPQGLYPHYGFNTLGDKEKKKLIVRRLEQLFTGKIGGRYARQQSRTSTPTSGDAATTTTTSGAKGSSAPGEHPDKDFGIDNNGSGDGAGVPSATAPAQDAAPGVPPSNLPGSSSLGSFEPAREARIQTWHSGKHTKSRDNMSTSNSNSNGDESGNGNGNGNGHSNVNATTLGPGKNGGSGEKGKFFLAGEVPDQRPTRLLDLDPDRVQVPADNMEYIRHLGLVPPEIGSKSTAKMIDVSPDADGWVYLNLLSNLAQLHILNVAPDFIRQAVVEKSTKFQLSPDGQKIRWRGGTDGTKFSSDGSTGNQSQHSQSTDADDGSDDVGQRKRTKTSGDGSASALSSSKKQSKLGQQDSGTSSSFQYKPLFVHNKRIPVPASGETLSSPGSDQPETSDVNDSHGEYRYTKGRNKNDTHSKSKSHSNSNSKGDISRSSTSRSGSSGTRKRHKSDGVLVYYSGMPFCTDLAGDSSGEASPTSNEVLSDPTQESVDEALQGRPTVHRSSSGSFIPFRPLTDYLSLSRDEWAGLGLLGIGTVGRNETCASGNDSMSSSASYISSTSNQEYADDDLIVLDHSSDTDVSSPGEPEPEPVFEASGINRVYPEDHFALRVTTRRPFLFSGSINACDEGHDDNHNAGPPSGDTFNMTSLANRVAALKRQAAPISAAVAMKNKAPHVAIDYVSAVYNQRRPVQLPKPAMFYPPFSPSSESSEDEGLLDSEGAEEEDESMLASSSVISRRANPHHSVNNASLPSPVLMSSGEDGDVEADDSREAMEMEDSM